MKAILFAALAGLGVLITPFAPPADAATPPASVSTSSGQQIQPCDCSG